MKKKLQTVTFIPASELISKKLKENGFWEEFAEDAPFSWGDNSRSLITAIQFANHCKAVFDTSGLEMQRLLSQLEKLNDIYIDLEN